MGSPKSGHVALSVSINEQLCLYTSPRSTNAFDIHVKGHGIYIKAYKQLQEHIGIVPENTLGVSHSTSWVQLLLITEVMQSKFTLSLILYADQESVITH